MRKSIKKFMALALSAAMATGTAANVMAASDTIYLEGGSADCSLECGMDYAYASTEVSFDYTADYVEAYVDVQIDILINTESYEYGDSASDTGTSYASCHIRVNNPYNMGASASSCHSASIGDSSGSCCLSEDAY